MTAPVVTSEGVDPASLGPDARALHCDLHSAAFTYGVDCGGGHEVRWDFPCVYVAVAAVQREGAPPEYLFRFECTNYSQQAPLCQPWDAGTDALLALSKRPTGSHQVGMVFRRDWENGQFLYTPLDRHALATHSDWPAKYSRTAWNRTFTISHYLTHLHDLLHSRSYSGVAGTLASTSVPASALEPHPRRIGEAQLGTAGERRVSSRPPMGPAARNPGRHLLR